MASNETIADIAREMQGPYYKMGRSNASLDKQMMDYMSFIANRIESAHKRAIAAKDDERLTIVAMYETIIADKDAKISKLRERLKVAEVALEKIDNMCDGDMCKHFDTTHNCSACRYLDGCQTGVAHAALAVIREKGANDGK